jgi:hypothetical protein
MSRVADRKASKFVMFPTMGLKKWLTTQLPSIEEIARVLAGHHLEIRFDVDVAMALLLIGGFCCHDCGGELFVATAEVERKKD